MVLISSEITINFRIKTFNITKFLYFSLSFYYIFSLDEATITSIIEDQEQMMATNEVLFKVYCGVIAEPLFNILTSDEDTVPDGLAGIENNE